MQPMDKQNDFLEQISEKFARASTYEEFKIMLDLHCISIDDIVEALARNDLIHSYLDTVVDGLEESLDSNAYMKTIFDARIGYLPYDCFVEKFDNYDITHACCVNCKGLELVINIRLEHIDSEFIRASESMCPQYIVYHELASISRRSRQREDPSYGEI